jgi:hypothetical protein
MVGQRRLLFALFAKNSSCGIIFPAFTGERLKGLRDGRCQIRAEV